MTLLEFFTSIDDRKARGLVVTSARVTYRYGLRLRVHPALGHLPVAQITAGMIDHTIDDREKKSAQRRSRRPLSLLFGYSTKPGATV